jgi:hypothetical protein
MSDSPGENLKKLLIEVMYHLKFNCEVSEKFYDDQE